MSRQSTRRTGGRRLAHGEDAPGVAPSVGRAQVEALISCALCKGFFNDAHTINECLHSFCLQCLESQWGGSKDGSRPHRQGSRGCPTCSIALGPQPYTHVICDRKLQMITDKIAAQLAACAAAPALADQAGPEPGSA